MGVWRLLSRPGYQAFAGCFADGNTGWIAAENVENEKGYNEILKTADGGLTWSSQTPHGRDLYSNCFCVDARHAHVVGRNGLAMRTADGGAHWTKHDSIGGKEFTDLVMFDTSAGYLLSYEGAVYRTQNGGANWDSALAGNHAQTVLYMPDRDTGWILSEDLAWTFDGWVHRGGLYGMGSIRLSIFQGKAIARSDPLHWFFSGAWGVMRTIDGGTHWVAAYPVPEADADYGAARRGLRFEDAKTGWLVMSDGRLYQTTDTGSTWVQAGEKSPDRIVMCDWKGRRLRAFGAEGGVYEYVWDPSPVRPRAAALVRKARKDLVDARGRRHSGTSRVFDFHPR
jgi:hypothetical protein